MLDLSYYATLNKNLKSEVKIISKLNIFFDLIRR